MIHLIGKRFLLLLLSLIPAVGGWGESLPVRALKLVGPIHLQDSEAQGTLGGEETLTLTLHHLGAAASFFVYGMDADQPAFVRYGLTVAAGGVILECGGQRKEIEAGEFRGWFPLPPEPGVCLVKFTALYHDTRVELRQLAAVQVTGLEELTVAVPPESYAAPFPNAGFELGTLEHWIAEGAAFAEQPTYKDNAALRMKISGAYPVGDYWIGTYERRPGPLIPPRGMQGDAPVGQLKSEAFTINRRYLSGVLGGGNLPKCSVALLVDGREVARLAGNNQEAMSPFVLDVSEYQGRQGQIVIVDHEAGTWGHVNVDDFCLFGE